MVVTMGSCFIMIVTSFRCHGKTMMIGRLLSVDSTPDESQYDSFNSPSESYYSKPFQMNIHAAIRLSNGRVGVYHFLTRTVIPDKSSPRIHLSHLNDGERLCQLDPSEIYYNDALMISVSPDRIDFTVFERTPPGFTNEWNDEYNHTDTEAGRCELLTSFVNSPINAGRGRME